MFRKLLSLALANAAAAMLGVVHAEPITEVVLSSEVEFQPLNPARGDASPRAGVLWGDIKKDVPSGALIVFGDGFSSPPHIHNITYRAIVISGAVHNDDPSAENLWMGPGSFWTQPAGESHITAAAQGSEATAFLEILEGPYLVQSPGEAFDNGERPVNVEARNVVWLDSADVSWVDQSHVSAKGMKIAFLWGSTSEGQQNGTLVSLPAGFSGKLNGSGSWLRAVLIQGQASHRLPGESELKNLDPGSYFGSNSGVTHEVECGSQDDCVIYISSEGKYDLTHHARD